MGETNTLTPVSPSEGIENTGIYTFQKAVCKLNDGNSVNTSLYRRKYGACIEFEEFSSFPQQSWC